MRSQSDSQTPRPILPIYLLRLRFGALIIIFSALMLAAYIYFRLSFIVFYPILLVGLLGLVTLSNYANLFNALVDEGAPRSIPSKFTFKMAELEEEANQMRQLGFEELDRHYIQRSFDGLRIIFKQQQRPIYWSLIHIVKDLTFSELLTFFENGSVLSTTSTYSRDWPIPEGIYVQRLQNARPNQLLEAHQDALEILMQYNYVPVPCLTKQDDLRQLTVEVERQVIRQVMEIPFWPLRMSFWTLFKTGRKYCVPLREQIANNTTQILSVES
ncbi:MAG: hypothetical protein ACTS2F_04690 [Thainema sp.]